MCALDHFPVEKRNHNLQFIFQIEKHDAVHFFIRNAFDFHKITNFMPCETSHHALLLLASRTDLTFVCLLGDEHMRFSKNLNFDWSVNKTLYHRSFVQSFCFRAKCNLSTFVCKAKVFQARYNLSKLPCTVVTDTACSCVELSSSRVSGANKFFFTF